MQAHVINVNDVQAFDYLLYPDQNPANQYYIQSQLEQFSQSLTDVGRQWMDQAKTVYQQLYDSRAARAARAAIQMAAQIFHPNAVIGLHDIDHIRQAQPVMQRYIMAEPSIRQLYQDNRCDGYYGTYIDIDPGHIGREHYDYRRVTDTMIIEDDQGWTAVQYAEDLMDSDRNLSFEEQSMLLSTWDIARMYAEAGQDPTDVFGGQIVQL